MPILKYTSKGLLFSVLTAFLWACVIVDTRYLLNAGENALNLTAWFAIIVLFPWVIVFRHHFAGFEQVSNLHKLLLVIIGIAGSIGINFLQALALANTTAVNFAFLYRTIIVFTIFFAWIFFKEKLTWIKGVLVVLILTGSYLLTTNGKTLALTKGDIYTLIMAASAAFIGNILIKHTVSKMHPDLSGSTTAIIGTITIVGVAIFSGVFALPHHSFFLVLGAILTFSITMTRNRAYKYATASFVTMVVSLTPLFVALLSFPLLGERLELVEIIGGVIIVGSTILAERFQI